MGEYYWGDLQLFFPDRIEVPGTDPVHISTALLTLLFVDEIDQEEFSDLLVTERFGNCDRDALAEFHSEELIVIDAFAEGLQSLAGSTTEGAEQIDVDGLQVNIGGTHSYGCAFFYSESDVEDWCPRYGIGYRMWDDGKNELAGELREWRPGMDEPTNKGHHAGGTVLDEGDAGTLWEKAEYDDAVFGALVRDYLEIPAQL